MNYQQAVREMFTLLNATLAPLVSVVNYPNTAEVIPPGNASWARVSLRHVEAEQRTIVYHAQRYENDGILTIQLFRPSGGGLGSDTLSTPVLKALRAQFTNGGAFFKRVTAAEIGISGQWYQTNVVAQFEYDSVENP